MNKKGVNDMYDCTNCRYSNSDITDNPCSECCNAYTNKFESFNFNPLWERINDKAKTQRDKGIQEYGIGLEDDNADVNTRLDRIEEELIDALMYIEHLREVLDEKS